MDRYERILTIHRALKGSRYPVPLAKLMDDLGCSRATLYRDIAFLRDALGAPIDSAGGDEAAFSYAEAGDERFELPGLWLTSEELAAILALNELMDRSDPGVLTGALAPFRARIEHLLSERVTGKAPPIDRIRVIPHGVRRLDQHVFRIVAGAVLTRRRLTFHYRARTTGNDNQRVVSPQRLTHYRDNWYLDAWDHDREALRSFSVDRIVDAHTVPGEVHDMADAELDEILAAGYGIFSGRPRARATIRFSAHAARWVADERWHAEQRGSWLPDGRYELEIPYANSSELLRDILKYGADAEVISPTDLRETVKMQLQLAQGLYRNA